MVFKRTEFDEDTKAKIYCRDRATCSFTGANLWVLDHGARWGWIMDWADHETPVRRGGKSVIENGVCASWKANSRKSANGRDTDYWFYHGQPTWHCLYENGRLPEDVTERLRRFARLQPSDWYLNRAVCQMLLALDWHYENHKKRDEEYYLKACLRFLESWRKALHDDDDKRSLEKRGVLKRPVAHDVRLLLKLREANTPADVKRIANEVGPIYRANVDAFHGFLTAATDRGRRSVLLKAGNSTKVSVRVIQSMRRLLADLDPKCGRLMPE